MKRIFKLIVISVFLATLFTTCNNDVINNDRGEITIFKAMLDGASEVPSNSSIATGTTTLTFYESTKTFVAVTTYSGLIPTGGHIHNAIEGENGAIVFSFVIGPSPITFESDTLTQQQIDELFNGRMYVNLHTLEFPQGEIRGQLIEQQ